MRSRCLRPVFWAILLCFSGLALAQPPAAFPGAFGYGANSTGGHGGTVLHVTNLNDSGTGSFRDAVSHSGHVIVFDVGGYVQLLSPVTVKSNITIAGQTAPGAGFGVFGCEVSYTGSNNITTRFIRFRDGSLDPNWAGLSSGSSHTNAVNAGSTNDLIFDHCDFEFAAYNNVDATACVNATIQYCIFANPIKNQQFNGHFETGPMTFLGNLWANSHNRNPLGKADLEYVNNIVYNYQAGFTTGNSAGVFHYDIINNYFIAGPSTTSASNNFYQVDNNQQAYATGNLLDGNADGILNGSTDNSIDAAVVLNAPWTSTTAALPTYSATNAFPVVVSIAGTLPHDEVDLKVVSDTLSLGTSGKLYSTEASGGLSNGGYGTIANSTAYVETNSANGMPDYWLAALGFSLSADNHNTAVAAYPSSYLPTTGYNALDEYMYFQGAPHAVSLQNTVASPASVSIDLSQYAAGFSAGAVYSLSNITNGAAVLQPDGHTVVFTPATDFIGRANFDFTVNDGRAMTQTLRVIVTPLAPAIPTPPPPPATLTWKGDGLSNNWDTSTANWINNTTAIVAYTNGSNASFDDTGSATPVINLTTALSPALVTVNSSQNYTFNGTGSFTGSGAMVKSGAGILTLANTGTNAFTGGVTLNAGTIALGSNTTPLGTGTLTLNGGNLSVPTAGGATYTNPVAITGISTIFDTSSNNVSLNGTISGSGVLNLAVNNGLTFTIGGSMAAFSGTLACGANASFLRFNVASGGTSGSSNATFDLGSGSASLTNRNGQTVNLGALFGGVNTKLVGAGSASTASTYNIGGNGLSTTFFGSINNGGGGSGATLAISKVGSGTLTLAGAMNHTGNTSVSGGTLIINGTFLGTVQSLGTGILSPGGSNNPVTLNVGGMALSGGNYAFDLSNSPSGPNDQIVVTNNGNISTAGNNTFLINMLNGTLGVGVYTLVTTTGTLNAASGTGLLSNLSSTSRQTYVLSRNASGSSPGFVKLTVSGGPASLTWTGATNATWDNSTANWSNSGTSDKFFNLDSVVFNGTFSNNTISIVGTVQPTSITINNASSGQLQFVGSGVIAGTGRLVVGNFTTIGIYTNNSFSGGTVINSNSSVTMGAGTSTALGSGNITLNGGILGLPSTFPATTIANPIIVTADSLVTGQGNPLTPILTGPISGSGNLTFTGSVILHDDTTAYTGVLTMGGGGLLSFNSTGSFWGLPNATLNLAAGTTANNNAVTDVTLYLGALSSPFSATLTASDQSAASGSLCTVIVGGLNTDSTFTGNIVDSANQAIALQKIGTGTLTLTGTNSYSGNTQIQSGTLNVTGAITGDGDMDVATGAALNLVNSNLNIGTLTIESGATLSGNGTIDGDLILNGSLVSGLGGTLTVTGDVVNNSVLRLTGGTRLSESGTFTNNGVLDLITGGSGLPTHFVNHGTVLLASSVQQVSSFAFSAGSATLQIQSYPGHNFQLQSTTSLGGTWQNVGSAQAGNGSVLTFTDSSPVGSPIFYRILVSP